LSSNNGKNPKENVRVKKVQAYPFAAQLVLKSGPVPAKILKLTQAGFLAEIASPILQAGEKLEVTFETPVLHATVKEQCVVIKLYTKHSGIQGAGVQHIAEIHFNPFSLAGKTAVTNFLNQLASKKSVP
jgi:hypothetical protein